MNLNTFLRHPAHALSGPPRTIYFGALWGEAQFHRLLSAGRLQRGEPLRPAAAESRQQFALRSTGDLCHTHRLSFECSDFSTWAEQHLRPHYCGNDPFPTAQTDTGQPLVAEFTVQSIRRYALDEAFAGTDLSEAQRLTLLLALQTASLNTFPVIGPWLAHELTERHLYCDDPEEWQTMALDHFLSVFPEHAPEHFSEFRLDETQTARWLQDPALTQAFEEFLESQMSFSPRQLRCAFERILSQQVTSAEVKALRAQPRPGVMQAFCRLLDELDHINTVIQTLTIPPEDLGDHLDNPRGFSAVSYSLNPMIGRPIATLNFVPEGGSLTAIPYPDLFHDPVGYITDELDHHADQPLGANVTVITAPGTHSADCAHALGEAVQLHLDAHRLILQALDLAFPTQDFTA